VPIFVNTLPLMKSTYKIVWLCTSMVSSWWVIRICFCFWIHSVRIWVLIELYWWSFELWFGCWASKIWRL